MAIAHQPAVFWSLRKEGFEEGSIKIIPAVKEELNWWVPALPSFVQLVSEGAPVIQ